MNKMMKAVEAQEMIQNYVKSVIQAVVDGVIKESTVSGYTEDLAELPETPKLNVSTLEMRGGNLYIEISFLDGEFTCLEIPEEQLIALEAQ